MKTTRNFNEPYRRHEIVARKENGSFRGVVWKDSKKQFETEGTTLDAVVLQLKKYVDDKYANAAKSRTAPPGTDEYTSAFRSIMKNITDGQFAMLKAHYKAPNMTLTASQLAEAAGYKGYQSANLHYGRLGFVLHDYVPTQLPTFPDGTPVYTFVLATQGAHDGPESEWQWRLRPEVAAAIQVLGLDQ